MQHESVNERSDEILTHDHGAPGEKTTMWLLSRDSIDYFVNFNLYACIVVFLGRLRTTRTTPLTRGRKTGNFTCPGTRCDMHIRISDQDASRANYRKYRLPRYATTCDSNEILWYFYPSFFIKSYLRLYVSDLLISFICWNNFLDKTKQNGNNLKDSR